LKQKYEEALKEIKTYKKEIDMLTENNSSLHKRMAQM